jgi:hypothetical protein
MKEEFDKAISLAIVTKDVQLFGQVSEELRIKFNVSKKTVHNRFHSMFGCSFRDYITERIIPAKDELVSAILNTSSSEECRKYLNLSNRHMTGIYDKNFGVSTYSASKEKILMSVPSKVRLSSLREDNYAILMSQYLGDGSYSREHHTLRIQHGHKQAEYLRWKVGMIIEGYNIQSAEIKEKVHAQGLIYYDWYSKKLGNVDFPLDKSEVPKLLTPLGWLLWYLDDGTYGQDISICTNLEKVAIAAKQELSTYGIVARVNKVSNKNAYLLTMCGGANSIRFYKAFIEPFLSIIPKCMLYKTLIEQIR